MEGAQAAGGPLFAGPVVSGQENGCEREAWLTQLPQRRHSPEVPGPAVPIQPLRPFFSQRLVVQLG